MSAIADARALLARERHATLCTAHVEFDGWPFGSIVPYAPTPEGDALVFLSDIAEHTKNLLADPRACLFVADPAAAEAPQAGARLALMVRGRQLAGDDAEAPYFARFPSAAAMRQSHGFAVWRLAVERVRWIAGFGAMGWIARDRWQAGA